MLPTKYFVTNEWLGVNRYSSVGIATRYGLNGPGIESCLGEGEVVRNRPDAPWCPPYLRYKRYWDILLYKVTGTLR
jgi:hypothetical protein